MLDSDFIFHRRPKKTAESLLYVEPRTPVTQIMIDEVRKRVDSLTYLAMFSYEAQRDGSLKAPSIDDIPNIAQSAGAANAMVVTNLEEFAFNPDLAHVLFTDQAVQNRLFGNLIQIANEVGYKDIHFDFELLHPEDRELYNTFSAKCARPFPSGRIHNIDRTCTNDK